MGVRVFAKADAAGESPAYLQRLGLPQVCFCLEQNGLSPSHHPNAFPTQTHVSVTVLTPEGKGRLSQWQESVTGVSGSSQWHDLMA